MRTIACLSSIALLLAAEDSAAQCAPQGMTLDMIGGRLGDGYTIELTGTPLVTGLVGVSLGAGPTPLPFGTFCLDIVPLPVLIPFALDGTGAQSVQGVLPSSPGLERTWYFQAFGFDPTQPTSFALSNGDSADFYPPRVYVLDPGGFVLFVGDIPAKMVSVNALDHTIDFDQDFNPDEPAKDTAWIPSQDAVGVVLNSGTIQCFDGASGATKWSVNHGCCASHLLPLDSGDRLAVLHASVTDDFAGVTTDARLTMIDPSTGASLGSLVPSTKATDIIQSPGADVVYIHDETHVEGRHSVTGAQVSLVNLDTGNGDIIDWMILGDRLWVLLGGTEPDLFGLGEYSPSAIHAIDLATGQAALSNSVELVAPNQAHGRMIRGGPGTLSGDSILVVFAETSATGVESQIWEISPSNLLTTTISPVSADITHLELSAGGTDWLAMQSGQPASGIFGVAPRNGFLFRVEPSTLFFVAVINQFPQEYQAGLTVLASDTQPRVFVPSGLQDLYSFATDPPSGPGVLTTLDLFEGFSAILSTN